MVLVSQAQTHKIYRDMEAPDTEARQCMTGSDACKEPERHKAVKPHHTQYRPARAQESPML